MAADKIPTKEIANELLIWSKANINTFSKSLSSNVKPIFEQMDKIVKTKGFQQLAEQPSEIFEQVVSEAVTNHFKSLDKGIKVMVRKTKTIIIDKSFESYIYENENIPTDKTIPENLIITIEE